MTNPNQFMVVQGNNLDENQLLGKFVYYSLSDVLVDKTEFENICDSINFPYSGSGCFPECDRPCHAPC